MESKVQVLFQELVAELGIAPLNVDQDGRCVIMVDETLPVNIALKKAEERLIFTSLIGAVPSKGKGPLLDKILQLNSALYQEHGMCLSIEGYTNSLMLSHSVDARLVSTFELQNSVACFLEQSDKCRYLLEDKSASLPSNALPNQAMCV